MRSLKSNKLLEKANFLKIQETEGNWLNFKGEILHARGIGKENLQKTRRRSVDSEAHDS